MSASKQYNYSGQTAVYDRVIQLSESGIDVKSLISDSKSSKEIAVNNFLDTYDLVADGEKNITSGTTIKAKIINKNTGEEVIGISKPTEFIWYDDENNIIASRIDKYTFDANNFIGKVERKYKILWNHIIEYSIGNTLHEANIEYVVNFTIRILEITEYVWNNCLTEKELEEQGYKNSGLWSNTIKENTENYLYLWVRKSNNNRLTWIYYRSTGEKGQQGIQGIQGNDGLDGQNAYTHIAYANSEDGSIDFSTTEFLDKKYIGIYVDFEKEDSEDYTKYKWKKYVADETRIEYCWHNSEENPPEELSASYDNLDIYYDQELVWISVFDTEHSIKAPNENDIHLWIRTSIDNGKNWEYSKFNGNPAKAIKIITNRYYFDRNETNDKGEVGEYLENQIANITLERQNISGNTDVSWFFDGELYKTQSIKQPLIITPSMLNNLGKLYISVVYDNVSYDSIELYTNIIKPTYAGILPSDNTSPVTINGRECVNGDHFIYLDENGSPVARLYINGKWKDLSSTDSQYYSLVMGDILADVINKPSVNSQNGIYQFFSNIAAYGAFIKNLYTENLKINNGLFDLKIGIFNNKLVFDVLYNGNIIFSIEPTTGYIFIGKPNNNRDLPITGFMFNPSTNTIISNGSSFRLKEDGTVYTNKMEAINAEFKSGKILDADIQNCVLGGRLDTNVLRVIQNGVSDIFLINTFDISLYNRGLRAYDIWKGLDNANIPYIEIKDDTYYRRRTYEIIDIYLWNGSKVVYEDICKVKVQYNYYTNDMYPDTFYIYFYDKNMNIKKLSDYGKTKQWNGESDPTNAQFDLFTAGTSMSTDQSLGWVDYSDAGNFAVYMKKIDDKLFLSAPLIDGTLHTTNEIETNQVYVDSSGNVKIKLI